MLQRRVMKLIGIGTLIALPASYAVTGVTTEAAARVFARARTDAATDLSGTWRGRGEEVASHYRFVETRITLQINNDQTFTETATIAGKETQLSGTVATKGDRVILQSSSGTRTTLVRTGDTLYGMLTEPTTAAVVEVRLTKA